MLAVSYISKLCTLFKDYLVVCVGHVVARACICFKRRRYAAMSDCVWSHAYQDFTKPRSRTGHWHFSSLATFSRIVVLYASLVEEKVYKVFTKYVGVNPELPRYHSSGESECVAGFTATLVLQRVSCESPTGGPNRLRMRVMAAESLVRSTLHFRMQPRST